MRISEGKRKTFASIAPPNVDEQFEYEQTEILKRMYLVDEDKRRRRRKR